MIGILGEKLGMTQVFSTEGQRITVTVIKAGPCVVTQIKTLEKEKYNTIQVGFKLTNEKKTNKPSLGHFKKRNLPVMKHLKEFRISGEEIKNFNLGSEIKADIFKEGELVNITGNSIGKGFQGVVRRWGFKGGAATHGSMSHRAPGSIGHTGPQHVLKGRRMGGHMGNRRVTVRNLKVVRVIAEKNILLVKGATPGFNGSLLIIKKPK